MANRRARLGLGFVLAGSLCASAGCLQEELNRCKVAKDDLQGFLDNSRKDFEAQRTELEALRAKLARAEKEAAAAKKQSDLYDKKVAALEDARGKLTDQYKKLLDEYDKAQMRSVPIPKATRDSLKDFAKKTKGFTFDEKRGISKFTSDILFDEGKDTVKPEAERVLVEFAGIFSSPDAKDLHLMIVGHTDNQPIVMPDTAKAHPTNWHLSVHRAIRVEGLLVKSGIEPERIGVAGYGEYQPVAANTDDAGQQKNRRVEIFVVAGPLASR